MHVCTRYVWYASVMATWTVHKGQLPKRRAYYISPASGYSSCPYCNLTFNIIFCILLNTRRIKTLFCGK
jgi:hypothetical protein